MIALVSGLAFAQVFEGDGFDAHGLKFEALDGDVRDPLFVQRPSGLAQGRWWAGGLLEYADRPLVWRAATPQGELLQDIAMLDDVWALNASTGVVVVDRLRLEAYAPLYFASRSEDQGQGAAIGDLRLSSTVGLLDEGLGDGFSLALSPFLDLPTGPDDAFLGAAGTSGGFKTAASKELSRVLLAGDLGFQFTPRVALGNLSGADTFQIGAGTGYLLADATHLGLEVRMAAPVSASSEPGTATPAEGYLTGRHRLASGGFLTGAFGTALSGGAGAANWRLLLGGGFGSGSGSGSGGPKDTDADGVADKDDACLAEPETANQWQDQDGCPDALATVTISAQVDGEPAAGATVRLWQDEQGPTEQVQGGDPWTLSVVPGTRFRAEASRGPCLAGSAEVEAVEGSTPLLIPLQSLRGSAIDLTVKGADGTLLPGAAFAWIDPPDDGCVTTRAEYTDAVGHLSQQVAPGRRRWSVTAEGYRSAEAEAELVEGQSTPLEVVLAPTKVKVTREQIVILDKVYFETAKAVIKPESFSLLDEVAGILRANPDLKKVEIGGHTDSDGNDDANLKLSQGRAEAVLAYLVQQGVEAGRLSARGYGETMPLMTNRTPQGKAQNRRVEFVIRERAGAP